MNPVQKHPHITESYACILKMSCYNCRSSNKLFNLFWNMFKSKTIKISDFIIQYIQSNPVSSNIRILIKIHYILHPLFYQVDYL